MLLHKSFLSTMLVMLLFTVSGLAQNNSDAKDSQTLGLVNRRQFVFKAQNMYPSSGKSRILTDNYTVTVDTAIVIADLPYIGKAYTASISGDGGIRFNSKDFGYEKKDRKKGGWEIIISPKDGQDVRTCQFTIYENGKTDLTVISNNRQTINYSGVIVPLEKKSQ